jgi:hypothetical protein
MIIQEHAGGKTTMQWFIRRTHVWRGGLFFVLITTMLLISCGTTSTTPTIPIDCNNSGFRPWVRNVIALAIFISDPTPTQPTASTIQADVTSTLGGNGSQLIDETTTSALDGKATITFYQSDSHYATLFAHINSNNCSNKNQLQDGDLISTINKINNGPPIPVSTAKDIWVVGASPDWLGGATGQGGDAAHGTPGGPPGIPGTDSTAQMNVNSDPTLGKGQTLIAFDTGLGENAPCSSGCTASSLISNAPSNASDFLKKITEYDSPLPEDGPGYDDPEHSNSYTNPPGVIFNHQHDPLDIREHGYFDLGIIHALAPQARLIDDRILNNYGVGDFEHLQAATQQWLPTGDIMNMSLTLGLPTDCMAVMFEYWQHIAAISPPNPTGCPSSITLDKENNSQTLSEETLLDDNASLIQMNNGCISDGQGCLVPGSIPCSSPNPPSGCQPCPNYPSLNPPSGCQPCPNDFGPTGCPMVQHDQGDQSRLQYLRLFLPAWFMIESLQGDPVVAAAGNDNDGTYQPSADIPAIFCNVHAAAYSAYPKSNLPTTSTRRPKVREPGNFSKGNNCLHITVGTSEQLPLTTFTWESPQGTAYANVNGQNTCSYYLSNASNTTSDSDYALGVATWSGTSFSAARLSGWLTANPGSGASGDNLLQPCTILPKAPTLTSPTNNAWLRKGQPITLQWTTSYKQSFVEVDGPQGTIHKGWQSDTSYTFTPTTLGKYSWRVQVSNDPSNPPISEFSDPSSFLVVSAPYILNLGYKELQNAQKQPASTTYIEAEFFDQKGNLVSGQDVKQQGISIACDGKTLRLSAIPGSLGANALIGDVPIPSSSPGAAPLGRYICTYTDNQSLITFSLPFLGSAQITSPARGSSITLPLQSPLSVSYTLPSSPPATALGVTATETFGPVAQGDQQGLTGSYMLSPSVLQNFSTGNGSLALWTRSVIPDAESGFSTLNIIDDNLASISIQWKR